MKPLTVALPKGRLLEPAADLFRRLGWRCDLGNGSRQLLVTEKDATGGAIRFLLAKPSDVPVYVDRSMGEEPDMIFRVGTHRETMKVAYADFVRLARPVVGDFSWQM